ncbi:hypothetical protein LCGC14_2409970 [marine sediment metagenome]|uniref:Transcription factor zinc-finger domain-containing protein n=1 Tax=marine sediment metagenome TaxID=412755 RepID=A0A0F9CEX3_9ZZZZ
MLEAATGRGCQHCEPGVPVEKIKSRAGLIHICLECVRLWFPRKSVDWWEERHAPFADHASNAIKIANKKAYDQAVSAVLLGS